MSRKILTNTEYRLLGKGLKYCPKPKTHNTIQLKQDIYEFTRKLRLKEFFDSTNSSEENGYNSSNKKSDSKSTFIPPTGRESTLDFYIEAVTNEILLSDKKYKYKSNMLPEEHEALRKLSQDESIIIKKADKGLTVVE